MPDKIDGDAPANGTPDAAGTAPAAPTADAADPGPAIGPGAPWRRRWMLVTAGIVAVIGVAAVGYSLATAPTEPAAHSPAPTTSQPGRPSPATVAPTGSTAPSATPAPSLVADGPPAAGIGGPPTEPPPPPLPPAAADPPPRVTRPAPPTGVSATAVDYYSIRVRWTDASSNEDGFYIEVYGIGRIEVAANATSYLLTDLLPKATRCFAVAAFNAAGSSAFAPTNGWACATTSALPPVTLPAAPSGLTTGTGSSSTGDLFVVAHGGPAGGRRSATASVGAGRRGGRFSGRGGRRRAGCP